MEAQNIFKLALGAAGVYALYRLGRQMPEIGEMGGAWSLKEDLKIIRRYAKKAAYARLKGDIPRAVVEERFVDTVVRGLERKGYGEEAFAAEVAGQQAAAQQHQKKRMGGKR